MAMAERALRSATTTTSRSRDLRALLEQFRTQYDHRFIATDPVQFPHRYRHPRDQEVVAFISALLSFGNAKAIIGSIARVLDFLGPEPATKIHEAIRGQIGGHRWVTDTDIIRLLELLQSAYERYRSLEDLFLEGYRKSDQDIGPALDHFTTRLKKMAGADTPSRGFQYFFPSPLDGSACKRLCMFLRWVVRPADGIDLGLWKQVSPSKLIIPLDVHLFNFARRWRLSRYKTPNWKMAQEVTESLKKFDPADPLKYDFAICHYGMKNDFIILDKNVK